MEYTISKARRGCRFKFVFYDFVHSHIKVPLFVRSDSTFSTQQLIEIAFVIPYFFVIDFAMKLPLRELQIKKDILQSLTLETKSINYEN